jgi:hypothetical protein
MTIQDDTELPQLPLGRPSAPVLRQQAGGVRLGAR